MRYRVDAIAPPSCTFTINLPVLRLLDFPHYNLTQK